MNYAQLFETIKGYCENDFPGTQFAAPDSSLGTFTSTEQINTFIEQAELRIYNTVQFPSLRKNTRGVTTATNPYLSAPTDFLAVYSLAVIPNTGDYAYLLNKDVNFLRESYPNPNLQGTPKYYALFGPTTTNDNPPVITNELSFILAPTPDQNYVIELHYYYYPESITVSATGRTWLGDNFDTVLLYGALLEAYTYMKGEPDVLTQYQKRYDEALAQAKRLGDGMERGDAYRDGQYRQKVV